MKYLIVIEQTATGYSAFSPDVPGRIATASTRDDVEREMEDAIAFHPRLQLDDRHRVSRVAGSDRASFETVAVC